MNLYIVSGICWIIAGFIGIIVYFLYTKLYIQEKIGNNISNKDVFQFIMLPINIVPKICGILSLIVLYHILPLGLFFLVFIFFGSLLLKVRLTI